MQGSARRYIPSNGRLSNGFMLSIAESDTNSYVYVSDDPEMLVDPFGLCPKCFAQLKYRPVYVHGKQIATHAFWWVQDVQGQRFVIDGGPSNGDVPPWGNLVDWMTQGDVSRRYADDNAALAGTWFDSGLSSAVCGQVSALEVTAEDWNSSLSQRNQYWAVPGPNSNSFARYIGEQGLFNPTAPPGSVGWSHPISTSQGPSEIRSFVFA